MISRLPGAAALSIRLLSTLLLMVVAVSAKAQQSAAPPQAGSDVSIPVSFLFNGSHEPDIPVSFSPDGRLLFVDASRVVPLVRGSANAKVASAVEGSVTPDGKLSPSDLRGAGLDVSFDQSSLTLQIDVPPKLRLTEQIDLTAQQVPKAAVRVEPADFSAQLSVRSRVDLIDRYLLSSPGIPAVNELQVPFVATLDPALNFRTFVLEGETTIDTTRTSVFSLDALRLVKDLPGPALRLMAGDLVYPVTGFESSIPILGFGVTRNFSLSPNRIYRPLGQMEFYLEHPSQVQVLVNGTVVRYLQLTPGSYNLTDFPLVPGRNNISVEIHDYLGRVEKLDSSVSYDSDLLLPGESAFSWNIGLPGRTIDLPVLSGFQRLGITRDLTLGAYTQADISNQMAGLEGIVATAAGTLRAGAAGSLSDIYGLDAGAFGSFRFLNITRPYVPSVTVSAQYRGRHFLGPESSLTESTYQWLLTGNIDQPLPRNLSISLGAGYRVPWTGAPGFTVSSIFTAPLGKGVSLTLNLGTDYTEGLAPTIQGSVTIISSASPGTTSININQSLTQPTSRIGVSYHPPGSSGLSVSGDLIGPPAVPGQSTGASATVNYTGNRFEGSLGYSILYDNQTNPGIITNHPFLRFGTAFVLADGVAGITRPVNDSFAIFVRHPEISKKQLGVNPTGSGYEATSDFLGEAVLADVHSYTDRLATVEVPDSPIGYDLGDTLFLLSLPYRSGTVVRVGTDATVYASGTLVNGAGKPIPLVAGTVTAAGGGESQQFFSDASGRFEIYGLRPGEYLLDVSNGRFKEARFTVPQSASGLYEIGNLNLTPSAQEDKTK
ncbi:carboxypeptidase regulatory-like domain-containing protein [Salinispira pacifica]